MGIVDYVRLILRTQRGCSFLRVGRMKSSCLFVSFVSTTDEFIRERKHQSDLSLPLPNAGIERLDVGPSEDLALPLPDAGIERPVVGPSEDLTLPLPNAGIERPDVGSYEDLTLPLPNAGIERPDVGSYEDLTLPLPNAGIERLDVGPSEDFALPLPDAGIERLDIGPSEDLTLPLPNAGIERLDVGPSEDLALPLPDAGIERQYGCPNLDQNIEELKDKYEKACIRNAALHRHVRGLSSSCALLKRENEILVSKLDRNAKELEEEKISSSDKTKILERENLKNLEKVRTFFQTMLQKRNLKVDQLENTISELNLKMVELEEEHQRDIENVRTRFSHVVRKQNENLVQLESRVADLIQQNCELNSIVDELEDSSYSLPDYYKLLKLDREAPEEEIRSAYRQKMRLIHPDKIKQHRPDADEKFYAKAKKLSIALHRGMEILKNPRLKYQYDIWLDMTNLKQTENLIKQYEAFEERTRCKQYQH